MLAQTHYSYIYNRFLEVTECNIIDNNIVLTPLPIVTYAPIIVFPHRGGGGESPLVIRHFYKMAVLFPTHESQICVENPLASNMRFQTFKSVH